jgi:type IV pilus assembly protein PilO
VVLSDYYAELPIEVRVTGNYHDVGQFAADIAALSRIVTLNNIALTPAKDKDGVLTMECIAKTFRYLDPEEQALRKAEAEKKGAKK